MAGFRVTAEAPTYMEDFARTEIEKLRQEAALPPRFGWKRGWPDEKEGCAMKMKHVSVVRPMFRQYGHGLSLLGVPPVAVRANHHVQTPKPCLTHGYSRYDDTKCKE